jgi:acyl-coenzyme A synthetase/AMP-(fatty) acid ligase
MADRPFGGHIIYSSGTTGTSKKMMMEGAIETKRNEDRARLLSFDANTVYHNLDFGLWVSLGVKNPASVWHMGGCVILDIRPNKFEHFFRHGVTSAYLVPPQLKDFLAAPRPAAPSQTPCELVVTAGVLTLDVAQAMTRQLSPNIFLSYASSEMGIPPLRSQFKTADDLYWFTPLGDRVVQVVDEDHRECPPGQEGLLRIGLNDLDCWTYVDDDEASAKVFHDGFFYPGDMAVKRADGRFRILGRATDVMNVQGAKIVVTPLEQAIQRELKVDEVCLFAGLNDDGVEEIVVAIQSGRELSQGELNMMRRHLPELTRVRFEVMKSFPRSEAGMKKTQRSVLRRMVFSKRQPT